MILIAVSDQSSPFPFFLQVLLLLLANCGQPGLSYIRESLLFMSFLTVIIFFFITVAVSVWEESSSQLCLCLTSIPQCQNKCSHSSWSTADQADLIKSPVFFFSFCTKAFVLYVLSKVQIHFISPEISFEPLQMVLYAQMRQFHSKLLTTTRETVINALIYNHLMALLLYLSCLPPLFSGSLQSIIIVVALVMSHLSSSQCLSFHQCWTKLSYFYLWACLIETGFALLVWYCPTWQKMIKRVSKSGNNNLW